MQIFIGNLMQNHFWIILKIIDIIGQPYYIVGTDTEFQERRNITGLMEKRLWEDLMKDGIKP
jgi:hypothetical protein